MKSPTLAGSTWAALVLPVLRPRRWPMCRTKSRPRSASSIPLMTASRQFSVSGSVFAVSRWSAAASVPDRWYPGSPADRLDPGRGSGRVAVGDSPEGSAYRRMAGAWRWRRKRQQRIPLKARASASARIGLRT